MTTVTDIEVNLNRNFSRGRSIEDVFNSYQSHLSLTQVRMYEYVCLLFYNLCF